MGEGVGEILDQIADFVRRRVFDPHGRLPEERVAELEYGAKGHLWFSVRQFLVLNFLTRCGRIEQAQELQLFFRRKKRRFERIPGQLSKVLVAESESLLCKLIFARQRSAE